MLYYIIILYYYSIVYNIIAYYIIYHIIVYYKYNIYIYTHIELVNGGYTQTNATEVYHLAARMMELSTNWYVKCKISVEHGRTGTCKF